MNNPVFFDHIEAHVKNVPRYCRFLVKLFKGGRYKVISDTGTAMFVSNDGINIEIKKKKNDNPPIASGFCNPCLRMTNARRFIEKALKLDISNTIKNPDGDCYFFVDHEGITWHIKNHLILDKYINW
jgi:hypothetical protein